MDLYSYLLRKKPILLDGAMGTQMMALGIEPRDMVNINSPDLVLSIHEDYINAGAEIIIANTFNLNRIYAKTHNMDLQIEQANKAGVEIAKKACINGQLVLGDMGPTGQLLQPFGSFTEDEIIENYMEQAKILDEAGVDGFIIETMTDLREAICSLKACKAISQKPVVVSITFSKSSRGYTTMMGDTLEDCVKEVISKGATVFGTNCSDLEPAEMANIVSKIRKTTDIPIVVQPNAGKPKLVHGQTKYDMSPEEFAQGIEKCIQAGANLIGGCCGTTPEHIARVRELI